MDIQSIRNDDDHREALKAVAPYFDNEPELGTKEGNHCEALLHFPLVGEA